MSGNMREMGSLIRERRKHAGLTQAELGQRIGRSRSWVGLLENGGLDALPDIETVERIAAELGVPSERIIAAAGYRERPVVTSVRERLEELEVRLSQLTEAERAAVWPSILQDVETVRRLRQGGGA